jgi:hypothetical protein
MSETLEVQTSLEPGDIEPLMEHLRKEFPSASLSYSKDPRASQLITRGPQRAIDLVDIVILAIIRKGVDLTVQMISDRIKAWQRSRKNK